MPVNSNENGVDLEEKVLCRWQVTIKRNDSFLVGRYEYLQKPEGERSRSFIAMGIDTPEIKDVDITLYGVWKTSSKGRAFHIASYSVALPNSKDGFVEYMKSLKCGIGKTRATNIFERFGEGIWFIIENQPERLKECGIDDTTIEKMVEAIRCSGLVAKVIKLFSGTNITAKKAADLVKKLGVGAETVLKDNPYVACTMPGFSFKLVDTVALREGVDPTNINRRKAAVIETLDLASSSGHVCLPREEVVKKMMELLGKSVDKEMCESAILACIADNTVKNTLSFLYTAKRWHEERYIADTVAKMVSANVPENISQDQISSYLDEYEAECGIKMAQCQRDAVVCAMTHSICVLTGGPGTGKSTTAKAVLYAHKKLLGEGNSKPVLLAPTGKAARRLSESTGLPASTIHSGIGIAVNLDGDLFVAGDEPIDGNIILCDEFSMSDQFITASLLKKVPSGARLVLIGDPEQLPSVGCGDVLRDLIRSGCVPTVKLEVIFRQAGTNPIVENSQRILRGDPKLIYNDTFMLVNRDSSERVFSTACGLYIQAVKKYGLDKTILLCPYRKSTDLNVNAFNHCIQQYLNPRKPNARVMKGKSVWLSEGKSEPLEFREGDKVMQTANSEIAKNGDTGIIRSIAEVFDEKAGCYATIAMVEFNGDGVVHELNRDDIRNLDLAYCSSVHKSQGDECKNVILVTSKLHAKMVHKNLFYTAITRAKEVVVLVSDAGEFPIQKAVDTENASHRYTLLADRLYSKNKK